MKSSRKRKQELSFAEIGLLGVVKQFFVGAMSLRRIDGVELPNEGRSSVEKQDGLLIGAIALGSVIPKIPFETLRILEQLSICNADFSQMVGNIVALGNTGHDITVDAPTESATDAALSRLNESASRLMPNGAGIDGLINSYLRQTAVFGAISSEDVIDFAGRRVEKVVIVPVEQIRFVYVDGQYQPHQQPNTLMGLTRGRGPMGLIPLNANTYRYYALDTIENSPYARPPAVAAVDILQGPQKDAIDNIKYILQKFGLLGFVTAKVARDKPRSGESDEAYKSRMQSFLQNARDLLTSSLHRGLLIAFDNFKFEHSNVTSDGRGAGEVYQVVEELAFSGMGSMAAFHGRNYTTTETFADVIYNILVSQMTNHQRLAKRRVERTYDLDLLLAGIPVDDVSVTFNRAESRNELQKAQADQIRQEMALNRAARGITGPDECAQEMGYDKAFDPELLSSHPKVAEALSARKMSGLTRPSVTATCRFDRSSQRYRLVSSRIEIAGAPVGAEDANVIDFKKKAERLAA